MAFQTNRIEIDGSLNVDGSIYQFNQLFSPGGGGGSGNVSWASGNVGSNNYVITANGDGSIVAESSLIFKNGWMGIGTSDPSFNLHVHSSGSVASYIRTTNSDATLGFDLGVTGFGFGEGIVWNRNNTATRFGTNGLERLTITKDGSIGIGITGPKEKFELAGNIQFSNGSDRYIKLEKASGSSGSKNLYMQSAQGGLEASGGFLILNSGAGGVDGGDYGPGRAGDIQIITGNGGDVTLTYMGVGGLGGSLLLYAGNGGSGGNFDYGGSGGNGGAINLISGSGGDALGTIYSPNGGFSGDIIISSGTGGTGYSGGDSGDVIIKTGGYGSGSYQDGIAGEIHVYPGSSSGVVRINGDNISNYGATAVFYAGSATLQRFTITAAGIVVNNSNADYDIRHASDTFTYAFYMDGATGKHIIGQNSSATYVYKDLNIVSTNTSIDISSGIGATSTNGYGLLIENLSNTNNSFANLDFACNTSYPTTYSSARIAFRGYATNTDSDLYNHLSFLLYKGTTGHQEQFRMGRTGNFHAENDVIAYSTTITSDIRLKKDIETIEDNSLEKILQLRPVTFDWIDKRRDTRASGFIAQEFEKIFPALISKNIKLNDESGEEYLHIRYTELIPHITNAMKQQQKIIDNQALEIAFLKEKMNQILDKINL